MNNRSRRVPQQIEWPTVLVAVACWGGFAALLVWHRSLPWPITVAAFALLGGWYMSLQHEVLHGHPTPWHAINVAIAYPPLSLWLPYPVYRDTHLLHHDVTLTVPGVDPESFYVSQQQWSDAGRVQRLLWTANRTFVGRLTIGPAIGPQSLVRSELRAARKDRQRQRMWLAHVVGMIAVSWLVFVVAKVPVWQYLLGYVYLGMSVTYVRSFVEHLAVDPPATRSAIVRSNPFFGVLFLWNNLHHTHHTLPSAPWNRLPALTRDLDAEAASAAGAGVFTGYAQVMRRYGVRLPSSPVHPQSDTVAAS